MPLEHGQLKSMRYSELNKSQLRHGIAKWAKKFQNYLQGLYYLEIEEGLASEARDSIEM